MAIGGKLELRYKFCNRYC